VGDELRRRARGARRRREREKRGGSGRLGDKKAMARLLGVHDVAGEAVACPRREKVVETVGDVHQRGNKHTASPLYCSSLKLDFLLSISPKSM
jgi:hypothetical protein